MSAHYERRLQDLASDSQTQLLRQIQRGVEKESLRINGDGRLAQTPHPDGLGSALCHPAITTDYSEALLEFITPVSPDIDATLNTLDEIHRFVYSQLDDELLWGASMPCILEGDSSIPVAEYGSSNIASMKTVYRYGLGHRYGRLMQTIAGIHYNFSMPDAFWPLAQASDGDTSELQDYISTRYLDLIRNFQRLSWLLIYLFGASPAVCKSFTRDNPEHGLIPCGEGGKSLHMPYGTALRMGDLGYQSNAQKNLEVCYNNLDSYIDTLHTAITTSHPDYQDIGVGEDGHSRQLNTSLLQIENEFYSAIRPKRVTRSGEVPLGALRRAGIEYIEVRCVDVNPFLPLGLDEEQMRCLDLFLLNCLIQDSPDCNDDERTRMAENTRRVVNRGREPGLTLHRREGEVTLSQWADDLLDQLQPLAQMLDGAHGGNDYQSVLETQRAKVQDPSLTPSAQILQQMEQSGLPFFRLAMQYSQDWAEHFRSNPLTPQKQAHYEEISRESISAQSALEAADSMDFEEYLQQYYAQYDQLKWAS